MSLRYRPEIDGLRAIAVVPVILFHAGFQALSGGFVGVDIFFVISGYLITSIILIELGKGSFTVANFYERRARRILPALFFMLAVSLPFAWFWLAPSDMRNFAQSLTSVVLFSSNILFWRTSGYFNTDAELTPLLHTWSLAVEEQFYLLFPLILLLLWRLGRRWIWAVLPIAGVVSLTAAQLLVMSKSALAFFLLPTRAWELLIGALAAVHSFKAAGKQIDRRVSEIAGLIGLLLIAYSVLCFNKYVPFPSLWTLVPTLGAVLILLFSDSRTLVGRLLAARIPVGIGLISYSAYLWHQPLLAFARLRTMDDIGGVFAYALVSLSLLLGFFSWKYIEAPFRNRSVVSRRAVLFFSVVGGVVFALLGVSGSVSNGFENRISSDRRDFLCEFDAEPPNYRYFAKGSLNERIIKDCNFFDVGRFFEGDTTEVPLPTIADECFVRSPAKSHAAFVWGDSHAQFLSHGLIEAMPDDWQVLRVTSSGCIASIEAQDKNAYCRVSNEFAWRTIAEARPEVVIVGQNRKHSVDSMLALSDRLKSLGVKRVVFTGPAPHWKRSLPKIVAFQLWDELPKKTWIGLDRRVIEEDARLKSAFPQNDQARYLSLVDYFCDDRGCDTHLGSDREGGLTAYDDAHLTPLASISLARNLLVRAIVDDIR